MCKITLSPFEFTQIKQQAEAWSKKHKYPYSLEFVLTLISQYVTEDLDKLVKKVFDEKTRIVKEEMEQRD